MKAHKNYNFPAFIIPLAVFLVIGMYHSKPVAQVFKIF